MVVTSLALDGCSIKGMATIGALRRTHELGYWDWNDIETIVGISSGSIVGVMLSITRDWEVNEDYLVKRPWDKVVVAAGLECPLQVRPYCRELLQPLLTAAGLSGMCTLQQLYDLTRKRLVIVTCTMSTNAPLRQVALDHCSHPDMPLVEACARSCSLVPLFCPILADGQIYVDGGFANGNSAYAAQTGLCPSKGETLHVQFVEDMPASNQQANLGICDATALLLRSLQLRLRELSQTDGAEHVVAIKVDETNGLRLQLEALVDSDVRARLIECGRKAADSLISRHLIDKLREKG